MGEGCCGGHAKRRGFGIYANDYYGEMERSSLRKAAVSRIIDSSGSDGVLLKEELNAMNRAGSQVIATNHELRAEIYDLQSEINILTERLRLVRESKTIEDAHKATYFPHESQFRPVNEEQT